MSRPSRAPGARRLGGVALLALGLAAPAAGQEMDLDRMLELSLSELVELKVVSAKQPGTINQVPATVRVITAEQIRERGYLTLEDALADLPGFQFRDIQGFNSYVFLRGVPSQNNKVLLLVDGIQVNELNSGGFYGGGQLNLASVERIEVLYGPASALYGTNAVSGIVNVITRAPEEARGGEVSVLAGSFDTLAADVRYGAHDPATGRGFSLSAMVKRTDKADLRGTAGDGNWTDLLDTSEEDWGLDGRVRSGALDAGFVVQDKEASRATTQRSAGEPFADHGVNWHIRFVNGWASYTLEGERTWSLRTTAYLRDSTVLRDTVPVIELPAGGSQGRQLRSYRPGRLVGGETLLAWAPARRWSLTAGAVLEHETLSDDYSVTASESWDARAPRPGRPPTTSTDLVSVHAQARVALAGPLELFAGARYDDSSSYGDVTTPRLGLVYNRGGLTLKALYMEAFRAPRPWDFTDGLGNRELEPETMRSRELAAAWSPSEHVRVELCAFRNRLDGLLARSGAGGDWRWVNAGGLDTDGLEASAEYRGGRAKAYGSYSYTDSADRSGGQVAEIARHGATAGVAYVFTAALSGDLRARYLGRRENPAVIPATGGTGLAGAVVLDAVVTLDLPRGLFLQLAVDNLTDREYYHPSNLPPSRYRQPQRGIRLRAGHAF